MDIQTRKIEFVQEFLRLENEDLLLRLEKLLHSNKIDSKPMSINEFHTRIETSMEDSKNERLTKSSELIAEIEKWA